MKVILLLLIIILVLIQSHIVGQSNQATMTNATVIKLVKSGPDNDIIITTINAAKGKYDVTVDGLISLKTGDVRANIIKAMMTKVQGNKGPKAPGGSSSTISPPPPGAITKIPEPEIVNTAYVHSKSSNTLKALEKASATSKAHPKAFGMDGTSNACKIAGDKSNIRLVPDEVTSFVINTHGRAADALKLFKLESKKKMRLATISEVSDTAKVNGIEGNVAIQVKIIKPGIFGIIPENQLETGTYFFTLKQMNFGNLASLDTFAFGIYLGKCITAKNFIANLLTKSMKKITLAPAFCISGLASCSKSTTTSEVKIESKQIGKWRLKTYKSNDRTGSQITVSASGIYNAAACTQIESGNTIFIRIDNTMTLTVWRLLNNEKTLTITPSSSLYIPKNGYDIKTLDDHSLAIYSKEVARTMFYEITNNLEKWLLTFA